jgi:Inositol-pentakisphosphate 2-kinase
MDAIDWEYVGEGGMNVLFSYHPKHKINDEWLNHLLRLVKDDLAIVSSVLNDGNTRDATDEDLDLSYKVMISERLKPYIDIPIAVKLSWEFLRALKDKTISTVQVARYRRSDWNIQNSTLDIPKKLHTPYGMIIPDYRVSLSRFTFEPYTLKPGVLLNVPMRPTDSGFTIEIKPKAGYRAFSPLVNASRVVKLLYPRFRLMQLLYCKGLIVKGWMGDSSQVNCMSAYNPLDLFSNDQSRIKSAIYNLFDCPQNNLKMWKGLNLIFNSNINLTYTDLADDLGVHDSVSKDSDEQNRIKSYLVEIISTILKKESLLMKLNIFQRLDILDADGAVIVYDRLVHLCNLNRDMADSIIDSDPTRYYQSEFIHHLLDSSPFQLPEGVEVLCHLCNVVEEFVKFLEKSFPLLPSPEELLIERDRISEIINNLTIDECRFLLQTWLLSLTMCDVSIFISIEIVESREKLNEDGRGCERLQKENEPGLLEFRDSLFLYTIKLIDFDRKPCKKLRKRLAKEEIFDFIQELT